MALNFGTSGVRGLVTEFTPVEIQKYIHSFVKLLRKKFPQNHPAQILIAGDLRDSTPLIKQYIFEALNQLNISAIDLGTIPTPALAWACQLKKLPGIMVTGSHIPADRNGIKFYFSEGEILKTDEAAIVAELETIKMTSSTHMNVVQENGEALFVNRYTDFFYSEFLKNFKIVLYEHSSVAAKTLKSVLENLGATVISYGKSNKFIAVDTEAITSLEQLSIVVKNHHADILVSTDGDGDRPLVLAETGELVKGDQLGLIAAITLNASHVITPITSTTAIEKIASFQKVVRTKVGSPYVIEAMQAYKNEPLVVGFEANGGLLLGSDWNANGKSLAALPTRDSILPILLALLQMKQSNQSLSKVIHTLPHRFGGSDLVRPVEPEKSLAILNLLNRKSAQFFQNMTSENLGDLVEKNQMDGLRVKFSDDSILHFRPSGNAPEFRIYTESSSKERAENLLERAKSWIKNQ